MSRRMLVLSVLLAAASLVPLALFFRGSGDASAIAPLFMEQRGREAEEIFLRLDACLKAQPGDRSCMGELAHSEILRYGPGVFKGAVLIGLERSPAPFEKHCHNLMHLAGQSAAFVLSSLEHLGEAARSLSGMCQFGMYHGLVEGYTDVLSLERLTREIPMLCAELRGEVIRSGMSREYVEGECFHVLGHAAARSTEDRIDEGLSLCDLISVPSGRTACATGVVMNWTDNAAIMTQGSRRDGVPEQYLRVDPEARWLVCETVPVEYQPPCLEWMGSAAAIAAVHSRGASPQLVYEAMGDFMEWCYLTFSSPDAHRGCAASVGMMAGSYDLQYLFASPAAASLLCQDVVPDDMSDHCLGRMVGTAISFFSVSSVLESCELWDDRDRACAVLEAHLDGAFAPGWRDRL